MDATWYDAAQEDIVSRDDGDAPDERYDGPIVSWEAIVAELRNFAKRWWDDATRVRMLDVFAKAEGVALPEGIVYADHSLAQYAGLAHTAADAIEQYAPPGPQDVLSDAITRKAARVAALSDAIWRE